MKLSVVLGTLNRRPLLEKALASMRESCQGISYELIVVDGGSSDGTADYLIEQEDVKVIWQRQRRGAVAAFNAGFLAARGEFVANLNDDVIVLGETLALACSYLEAQPDCGQVAIPFFDPGGAPKVEYVTAGLKRQVFRYANFGVTRKALGDLLGWWGKNYEHYGGDTELSLLVWKYGYTVDELEGGLIEHLRSEDPTRVQKYSNRRFREIWDAWDGEISERVHLSAL